MGDIEFAYKPLLWLLLIIPVIAVYYFFYLNKSKAAITWSANSFFKNRKSGLRIKLRHLPIVLRLLALSGLIVACARPQSSTSWQDVTTEGIDIVLALDISGSMLAQDFEPNRLEASKEVALEFIENRPTDRIGLVVYAGESFTQCPLTSDHSVLKNLFSEVTNGIVEDGTAIGLGLSNAVNRLKDSDAKSKVVILLTDGINNQGSIPPITAAEIAQNFGVRVYTVGVGTKGKAPFPVQTPFGKTQLQYFDVDIDEETLSKIANMTGGKYFRATDNKKLKAIYNEIDAMEKSKINVTEFRKKSEEFEPWVTLALIFLAVEFLLKNTLLKSIV